MKHTNILITIFLLFATLTLAAQNNYSPCYTNNMSKGNTAFSQGKYSEARTYYVTAKQCAGGNPAEAQKKIAACDAKIKAQKEAAEAKKRAEHEAAEAKKRAEEMRKKEEEARKAEEKQLAICPHSVKDYDGNVYATVYIGSQCWMAENLRTTHYAYGTSIDLGKDTSFSVAYYYYPDNKTSNATQYGLLYNWKAVMDFYSSSKNNPSGVQGICPRGWHVPSEAEWKQLIEYVASQDKYFCNGQAGYISKALASKEGWCPMGDYDDDCRVGNDPQTNNATGFSAVPAGRSGRSKGFFSTFWSTTSFGYKGKEAACFSISWQDVIRPLIPNHNKTEAYSVRCVKD